MVKCQLNIGSKNKKEKKSGRPIYKCTSPKRRGRNCFAVTFAHGPRCWCTRLLFRSTSWKRKRHCLFWLDIITGTASKLPIWAVRTATISIVITPFTLTIYACCKEYWHSRGMCTTNGRTESLTALNCGSLISRFVSIQH